MGTSFDCAVTVSAIPLAGKLRITVGPLEMGNLAEMLDYLASEEFRDMLLDATSQALTADDSDAVAPDAQVTAERILRQIIDWQIVNNRRMTGGLIVSIADVREWHNRQQQNLREQGFPTEPKQFHVGETGTLWGVPCLLADLPAGTYRIDPC